MLQETSAEPAFGDQAKLAEAMSDVARGMHISGILKISIDIRAMVAAGKKVYNLALGDFDPRYFPAPEKLVRSIQHALENGATNYPPPSGLLPLRQAVSDYVERSCGVRYPVESILISCGGRPIIYGAYRTVVSPGDTVVYSVPSWQNDSYAWLSGARAIEVEAHGRNGFQPTLDELAPHLSEARLLCLCSPGNPTGTAMEPEMFRSILEAVVEENHRRERSGGGGGKPLFVLYDQIYGALRVKGDKHRYAVALVPESAPYVISMDGISKAFASTGLRLGWVLAPPAIVKKMGDLLSHVGAWAPHAEQIGVTELLNDPDTIAKFRETMDDSLHQRLDAMYHGFAAMRDAGLPVDVLYPDGAIYVSLQLNLIGRTAGGKKIGDNETIRTLLLEKTGIAVVPFQAFGLKHETGWFRLSAGGISLEEIEEIFPRVRAFLAEFS
jgi:aspartate aminotransferase